MSVFHFEYSMRLDFTSPCREHAFALKCYPVDNERQKILSRKLEIAPATELSFKRDWAGNTHVDGLIVGEHSYFSVKTEGEAETYASFFEEEESNPSIVYRYATARTQAGERIRALAEQIEGDSDYDVALSALRLAHESIRYRSGSTGVQTTAEEALAQGSGVCQDYAHLYLALLRLKKIPCRYVAGLVTGEGESHAWAEVNCKGYWYAFDPTADKLVGDGYLKLSHGRDAFDCAINRGSFKGFADQRQTIHAAMREQ